MTIRVTVDTWLRKFERNYTPFNLIEISHSALLHNFDFFLRASKQLVIPVLKSNAYGHGIEQVTRILKDRSFPYLAVDGYYEALRIRKVSKQPVLILGMIQPKNFAHLRYDNFTFVVQDEATIHALGKTNRRVKVHLECNTGMNRYGVRLEEVARYVRLIQGYKNLNLEGVMSHLADSDGSRQVNIDDAVALFDTSVEAVLAAGAQPTMIHIAQTAGSLRVRSKYANAVRIGIGLYGVNPFSPEHAQYSLLHSTLRPALKLTSTITKVIDLDKGDRVGYNYAFTALKKMRIGVLPIGYYEAVDEALANTGIVKVGHRFMPFTGRICMNVSMIDLSETTAVAGDTVVIYSDSSADNNTINGVATQHELFSYSLLTRLSSDLRRVVVE